MSFLFGEHRLNVPVKWRVAILCALVLVIGAYELREYAAVTKFEVDLARAFSSRPSDSAVTSSWNFPFQQTRITLRVEVGDQELAAAEAVDTDKVFGTSGALQARYISAFVKEQSKSAFVDRLAGEFQAVRDQRELDPDEYLELMTAAVQSIPYGTVRPRVCLAPEVLVAGNGICTDKTLLLASLLVHEGYDTVVWVFPTQAHVALGVASDRAGFRGTGYAFIETTQQRFIGQVSTEYLAAGPIAEPPMQIALGGWRRYGAGDQVEAILAELDASRTAVSRQRSYAAFARTSSQYREQYAALATDSWVAEGRGWFIMAHPYDREGVYSVLEASATP